MSLQPSILKLILGYYGRCQEIYVTQNTQTVSSWRFKSLSSFTLTIFIYLCSEDHFAFGYVPIIKSI